MNRPPAFQFYPKDFLSDMNVITMTMEERGYYITLLCMCWIEGCLKGGCQMVEAFVKQRSSIDKICSCFYVKNGDLYHKRLDAERQKQIEWREKSSQGGKISGEKRRMKGGAKGGSRVVQPKSNQRATLQSSVFSLHNKDIRANQFEIFWQAYPKKKDKQNSYKAFLKINPQNGTLEKMLEAIEAQKKTEDWIKDEGRYIPLPTTWLNGKRWEDEVKASAPVKGKGYYDNWKVE